MKFPGHTSSKQEIQDREDLNASSNSPMEISIVFTAIFYLSADKKSASGVMIAPDITMRKKERYD